LYMSSTCEYNIKSQSQQRAATYILLYHFTLTSYTDHARLR